MPASSCFITRLELVIALPAISTALTATSSMELAICAARDIKPEVYFAKFALPIHTPQIVVFALYAKLAKPVTILLATALLVDLDMDNREPSAFLARATSLPNLIKCVRIVIVLARLVMVERVITA